MPTIPDSADSEQLLSSTLKLGIYISFLQVLPTSPSSVQGHLRTVQVFFGNTPGPSSFKKEN